MHGRANCAARFHGCHKRLAYLVRATTFCESYQENNRRWEGSNADERSLRMSGMAVDETPAPQTDTGVFAFDDEVYHGGWSELTTYMGEDYVLGSASLPYLDGGHADSVMVRIARGESVRSMADFRSGRVRRLAIDSCLQHDK